MRIISGLQTVAATGTQKNRLAAQRDVLAASLKDIGRVKSDPQRPARVASRKATAPKDATAVKAKAKRKVA
jgi:hypothetical protein